MKKLLSILLTIVMVFSVCSVTSVAASAADKAAPVVIEENPYVTFADSVMGFFSDAIGSLFSLFIPEKELPDVSEWTKEDVLEYYKKAASKSAWYLTGERTLDTSFYGAENAEVSQVFSDYVQSLTPTRMRGVMGDYKKLTVDDCKSAKAYVDGDCVVIEIVFKDEVDSMHDENDIVTASHGMKLLEKSDAQWTNIRMLKWLYGINVDLSEGDYLMEYSDVKAEVKINKKGLVEEGKWSFDATMTFVNVIITVSSVGIPVVTDGKMWSYKSTMIVE